MADGYLNFDTKINEKGFNDGISKLGSLGKSGLSIVSKAMTGAIAAVGTGAAAIIKSSLGVVANMEQQVGGVETLFKDSANTVIANANKAYKTAGMSANNYMETVTSFSASLLQSLGGDTAKAASTQIGLLWICLITQIRWARICVTSRMLIRVLQNRITPC